MVSLLRGAKDVPGYPPPNWEDDERMAALFRPLPPPQQTAARSSRLLYWGEAVHAWAAHTDTLTFTVQEVQRAFLRNSQLPLCLLDVLQYLMQKDSVCLLTDLDSPAPHAESWGSWGSRLLTAPPRWLLGRLRGTESLPHQYDTMLDLRLLQDRSKTLYDQFWRRRAEHDASSHQPRLVREASLIRKLSELCEEMSDLCGASSVSLCVQWLRRRGLLQSLEKEGETYVRMVPPGHTLQPGEGILFTETVEVELESACRELQRSVDDLSQETLRLQKEAKMALGCNNRNKALSLLRRRRRVEASLKVQLAALDNATSCSLQLKDARVNRTVIAAFRTSALALKELVSGDSSADAVSDTMDQLQEVLEECQDVGEALSSSVGDEATPLELEAELNELLSNEGAGLSEREINEPTPTINDQQTEDVLHALQDLHIPSHDPNAAKSHSRGLDESAASVS